LSLSPRWLSSSVQMRDTRARRSSAEVEADIAYGRRLPLSL
jgi:hypothetical protein